MFNIRLSAKICDSPLLLLAGDGQKVRLEGDVGPATDLLDHSLHVASGGRIVGGADHGA